MPQEKRPAKSTRISWPAGGLLFGVPFLARCWTTFLSSPFCLGFSRTDRHRSFACMRREYTAQSYIRPLRAWGRIARCRAAAKSSSRLRRVLCFRGRERGFSGVAGAMPLLQSRLRSTHRRGGAIRTRSGWQRQGRHSFHSPGARALRGPPACWFRKCQFADPVGSCLTKHIP